MMHSRKVLNSQEVKSKMETIDENENENKKILLWRGKSGKKS
jgi:hypothetical protein